MAPGPTWDSCSKVETQATKAYLNKPPGGEKA